MAVSRGRDCAPQESGDAEALGRRPWCAPHPLVRGLTTVRLPAFRLLFSFVLFYFVIASASEAIQSFRSVWIASSLSLLAMTVSDIVGRISPPARARSAWWGGSPRTLVSGGVGALCSRPPPRLMSLRDIRRPSPPQAGGGEVVLYFVCVIRVTVSGNKGNDKD